MVAAPAKPTNISDLLPVRTIGVYKEGNWFRIETDAGDKGVGGTVPQALRNLKDTASGIICLDTVEYLILSKDTEQELRELETELRPAVRLCLAAGEIDLEEVAEYLDVYKELPKLKVWENGQELPVISAFGDGIIFLKKVEKRA